MQRLLFCIGTRPEAIKLAPLILESKRRGFKTKVLVTGQHETMLVPFLKFFEIEADFTLKVLKPNQSLAELSASILQKVAEVLKSERPECIFVQGDTTTAFVCALGAFYEKIPVAHIEAGLRTFDRYSPFPEEMNRSLVGRIAEYHFAPTGLAQENLAKEGIVKNVFVTGNTGIDALRITLEKMPEAKTSQGKMILVTCHRRENHGAPLEAICDAILDTVQAHPEARVVFPVHLNPNVQNIVRKRLGNHDRISLIEPQGYSEFASLMREAYVLLTDSGGVQEEAPYLKKPILVLRESTERPEGVSAGVSILVGSDRKKIVDTLDRVLRDSVFYQSFQKSINPYGDGHAAEKILDQL